MQKNEKRQEYRLVCEETVLLELMSASFDGQSPSEVLICNSVDISANGLQVSVNQPLQPGLVLDIVVQMEEHQPIKLVTEVKWQSRVKIAGEWLTGLELLNSEGSNLAEWKRLIAMRLQQRH